jgi:membrane-associated protein
MLVNIWQLMVHFDTQLPHLIATHIGLACAIMVGLVYLQVAILPLFFIPGNPFLFVCGAVWAGTQFSIIWLLFILLIAALMANSTAYWLGKTIGYRFFVRLLKWPNPQTIQQAHAFYEKHGEKGFLLSLFVPIVRTVAPFGAGVTNMQYGSFFRASSLGAAIWIGVCVLAGYFFGNIPIVKMHLGLITLAGLGLVVLAFILKKVWVKFVKN